MRPVHSATGTCFAQQLFDGFGVARMHLAARPNQRAVDVSDEELRQLAGLTGAAGYTDTRFLVFVSCS